jgi:putative aldouronate transport system permease protein
MNKLVKKKTNGFQLDATWKQRNARNLQRIGNDYDLYLMMIPMVLMLVLFTYRPIGSLIIAFKDYSPFKGILASPWAGLSHYKEFFNSPYAGRVIRNTVVLGMAQLFLGFPLPIIFALLLNELRGGAFKKTVQTVSFLPHFISTVVVCSMVMNFLSPSYGVINSIIQKFGGEPIYFLTQPKLFLPVFITMILWRETGYNSIVYISALTSISEELYEAATVDGANRWKQLWHITLPELTPTIVIMLLVQLGAILNVSYEAIILLYNPSIYETADIISTFVYRVGMQQGRYDYSTAIDLMNSVFSFILVIGANKLSKRLTETSLW